MAAGLSTAASRARRWRRRGAWCAVLLGVLLVHGEVAERIVQDRIGFGEGEAATKRIELAFVRELKQQTPPAAPPPAARPRRRPKPARAIAAVEPAASASAASAPEPAASEPVLAQAEAASAPETPEDAASAPVAVAAAPPMSAASAAAANFDWPPSTQLRYDLNGYYQGPVQGSAEVRWVRVGVHYQVQMDVVIGLRVAPLMSRVATSDGEVGPDGLVPQSYEEVTKVGFGEPRRIRLRFDPDQVVLADGSSRPRPNGLQDSASQFVQMTWLFTIHPEWLQTGRTVELPLALARRIDRWSYDVLEEDTLYTPFGAVPVMHVKPRRLDRPGNVLTVECWFAPSLQYLPARILIRQSEDVWADLTLAHAPLQAAPASP